MDIDTIVSSLEVELEVAQKRLQKAQKEGKAILETARKEARASLTAEETTLFESLRAAGEGYRTEVAGIKDKLARATDIQAEERAADKLSAITHQTGAGLPADQRTFSAGNGRTLDNGALLYGAESTERPWTRDDGRPAALERSQRFADHEIVKEHAARDAGREDAIVNRYGSFGMMLRSMSDTSGAAIVPTLWSGNIIDRARNYAAVMKAGATVIPMDRRILQIGRLTAQWPCFK